MKIQLLSDIHLEFDLNNFPELTEDLDLLILAGDIGLPYLDRYKAFLQICSDHTKDVILITGNHEYYYSKGYKKIDPMIKDYLKTNGLNNIHFLQREWVDIPIENSYVRVLGCTLWTHIPDKYARKVKEYMSDYYKIKTKIEKNGSWKKTTINHQQVNLWHQYSKEWLQEEVAKSPYPMIIVSHHTPLLHIKDEEDFLSYGYHSNQKEILQNPRVKLWCHGHSHRSHLTKVESCWVWANTVGYPKEYTGYQAKQYIKLIKSEEIENYRIEIPKCQLEFQSESEESSFHESDFE